MHYFNLFSNIKVTLGNNRILFSDLQKNNSSLFPLELYYILEDLKLNPIDKVRKEYNSESSELIDEYINILLEKEYGFISLKKVDYNFPKMNTNFIEYSILNNVIVEFSNISQINIIKKALENLRVKHLVLFSNKIIDLENIIRIDSAFDISSLEGIELYIPFNEFLNSEFMEILNQNTKRIYNIIIFNCGKNIEMKNSFRFNLEFIEKKLNLKSCGLVGLDYFNTNLPKFLESLNHNSCLNSKLSIDKDGYIRNCPSMPQHFGNIKDTALEEALNHPDFKKYWNVTKDIIQVCKDCEFRHICTDCRAYTERTHFEEDIDLSKPLKCGYNPYTNEWEEWSTNPLKQKAIEYYGMQELVKRDL